MPPDPTRPGRPLFTAMKPAHRKAHQAHSDKNQLLPRRYYRWVIWFSISLYLLFFSSSSSLFPLAPFRPHKLSSLRKPTSLPVQALIDAAAPKGNLLSRNAKPAGGGGVPDPMSLRIYVYDLPSRYNRDWLANPRCATHLFAAEVALHRVLLDSPVRTRDPHDADFFFVPVYVSCNFSTPNGFPSLGHARGLLSSAVDLVSARYPFWNRSGGADHVFVASHDYGACFHAMVRLGRHLPQTPNPRPSPCFNCPNPGGKKLPLFETFIYLTEFFVTRSVTGGRGGGSRLTRLPEAFNHTANLRGGPPPRLPGRGARTDPAVRAPRAGPAALVAAGS
uniref:Putative glucuronoxylan glucuronosyltransferase F8H n=1 Tax=Anthurium amnicola TaxID=1678845 RepID=A0A1D1XXU1_9ARAE